MIKEKRTPMNNREMDGEELALGPKPQGVLIDTERSTRCRKGWR